MSNIIDQPLNRFAYDLTGLNQLKNYAAQGSADAIKQVAKQFESLFINMMMQSMRKAVPEGGLFNQSTSQMFTAMFDQQVAQQAAGKGFGLAEIIAKQLTNNKQTLPTMQVQSSQSSTNNTQQNLQLAQSLFSNTSTSNLTPQALGQMLYLSSLNNKEKTSNQAKNISDKTPSNIDKLETDDITAFIKDWLEPAKQAAKKSGIPYEVIIAQAALESGWGQKQIKTANNKPSYNYFGIKASPSWLGDSTRLTTHEFINDKMIKIQDDFRVYNSKQHALTDYLNLLTKNPRYSSVVKAPDARTAAKELQAANYATDPDYSNKLIQIISRIEQIAQNTPQLKAISGFKQIAFK